MQKKLDQFNNVIETFGLNRTAVKHALRMREYLMSKGDIDGATEWHVFALAMLRNMRAHSHTMVH